MYELCLYVWIHIKMFSKIKVIAAKYPNIQAMYYSQV